ncbi:PucR family transcriptional regulator [Nocardia arthritidis]|nr:helix-turn-helix domain-containing protein [Nocardia arthritidis]
MTATPTGRPEISPDSDVVRDWLAEFVFETMRAETLEQVVARLDNAIAAHIPELADRDMRRDLAASTRAQARLVLAGLTSNTFEYTPAEEAHAFARTIARRGYELRVLLQVYHFGLQAVVDYMTETVTQRHAPYEIERAVMLRLFDRATKWIGKSVELLTDTYMEERERVLRAALNRRTETVRALLAGDDLDLDQAGLRLGYRLDRTHLAFVLWTDDDAEFAGGEGEFIEQLERVANRIAAAAGAGRALTVPSGASAMWVWIGMEDAGAEQLSLDDALSAFGRIEAPVRVAFGMPGAQLAGFQQSHREAVAARQVAERGAAPERVTRYRDIEIAYLAGVDEAAMRGLIARELGALADRDANAARLRETLHAYLRSNRSPEAAAKLLGVHKNTVRYRIQRIEELLGGVIETRSLPLEIALSCVAVYGVEVLP